MVRVESVAQDSIGAEIGLTPGTQLLSVNGREVVDFLDWEFLSAENEFALVARMPDGDVVEYHIERDEDEPMGLELEPPRIRRCANRCDFCFVDGLPDGLRSTLYIRDDDYRLSFRHGNFATLTNLKAADIERILEYRLSPLYVSVHATDPVIRRRLLRHPLAPDILEQLEMFADGGIEVHTQIVLQPGVNDGPVLERSLDDLYRVGESVLSVSVVPVGLTEFSRHDRVREPTRAECRRAVDAVDRAAARAMRERGNPWAYGSDELYLVARLPLPPAEAYGDFDQVENGVGSVRFLEREIIRHAAQLPDLTGRRVAVVTGTAMGRLMPPVLEALAAGTGGTFDTIVLTNGLFGPRVTTAGLLPGSDIRAALGQRSDLDLALIPGEALNDDHVFVDDVPLEALGTACEFPVIPSRTFVDALAASPAA